MRAGRFIKQTEGYTAFISMPLPPDPPIRMDNEMMRLLSDADRALGRLDGGARLEDIQAAYGHTNKATTER